MWSMHKSILHSLGPISRARLGSAVRCSARGAAGTERGHKLCLLFLISHLFYDEREKDIYKQ
jgi:hypothetical protein